jgi:hypothetical protein
MEDAMTPVDFAREMHRLLQRQADEDGELYVADADRGLFSAILIDGHVDLVKLSAELIGWAILQRPS